MLADYHLHTEYSDDSFYNKKKCVKDACELGFDELCFTDHVDPGIKGDWGVDEVVYRGKEAIMNVDYPKYFARIKHLQDKYAGKIVIKKGLELGMQVHTINYFEDLLRKYPLDFAILSIHQIDNLEFWTHDFQKLYSESEYYTLYYAQMYELVTKFKNYSVLGHMDLLKRYDEKDGYDAFGNHKDIIRDILKVVINDGKGIEFNTSCWKYKLDDYMPSVNILKLYRELGGKIITIGSDSHKAEDLANGNILKARQILKDLGYETFNTFENMQPIFHKL